MSDPLVSIVLPNFNSEAFIEAALTSALMQTWEDFEIIIVDDGSNDRSLDLIKSFLGSAKNKIKVLTHPDKKNRGICETYRLGFDHASGEYIALLEQDDIWMPQNLEKKVNTLQKHRSVGCVFSDIDPFGSPEAERIRDNVYKNNERTPANKPLDLYSSFIKHNLVMALSCLVFRKSLLNQTRINTPYNSQFDWLFLSALAQQTYFLKIPERLVRWRIHRNSYHHRDVVLKKAIVKQLYHIRFFFALMQTTFRYQHSTLKRTVLLFKAVIKYLLLLVNLLYVTFLKTWIVARRLCHLRRLRE